jgi:hypothetical protein
MGVHQIKRLCTAKKQLPEWRENPENGKKIFASYSSNKGFKLRIYKELKNLIPK